MKKNKFDIAKLVAVTLALGFFSPSLEISKGVEIEKSTSVASINRSEGLLTSLTSSQIKFSLFTQAEAAKKKNIKRAAVRREARRRANYRHHAAHHYRDERRREHRRDVAGALIVGGLIGAAINESSQD